MTTELEHPMSEAYTCCGRPKNFTWPWSLVSCRELDSLHPPLQTPAPMRINAELLSLELSLPHAGRKGCA
jgi:hypothetical protein